MRKEFTAISAFSTIIAFTAGAVLCMQVSNLDLAAGVKISSPVLWAAEVAIFGTAVYAWRTNVSVIGWLLGIGVFVTIRVVLTSCAGMALALQQENPDFDVTLAQASMLIPRGCAALFALMVCYPLRIFLPERPPERRRTGNRFRESPAVASAAKGAEADGGLLIVALKDSKTGSQDRSETVSTHSHVTQAPINTSIEGEVELPMSTVLALLPEHIVSDRALALGDTQMMTISLDVILPQIKEAQVVFSVADLRAWIPPAVKKALVQAVDSDLETENGLVSLPLELIIPQLPPEAFELPPPSPPAWVNAKVSEPVVFARI